MQLEKQQIPGINNQDRTKGRKASEPKPESRDLRAIRNRYGIWMASLILAVLCTLITYPGIWYSDSYVRVTTGLAVAGQIQDTLTGHASPLYTGNAFTVIPSFFIAACHMLSGSFALYTFCQAFALFASVFLLIRELDPPFRKAQMILFALSPVIYGASVYLEANVGSLIGLIVLMQLFRRAGAEKSRSDRILELVLTVFASLITFGYRTNALTVVPVLVLYLFLSFRRQLKLKLLTLGALILGIALSSLIPAFFQIRGDSNASTGLVWEILTAIQRMEPEARANYLDYLDDLAGEGATAAALESSHENSVDGFMWGSLGTDAFSAPGAFGKVLGKYFRLLAERPGDWLAVKADFAAHALGFSAPLDLYEYPYNRWEKMAEFQFNDSRQRELFHASVLKINDLLGFFTCRPWVAFLISGVLVILEKLRKNRKTGLYALLWWLAAFYYLAYLIMIVVFQQRMFYPSLVLLLAVDAAITLEWIQRAVYFLQRPGKPEVASDAAKAIARKEKS